VISTERHQKVGGERVVVENVEKYKAVVEVEEGGSIRLYFGIVGVEIPSYKYLSRIRKRILWAVETARKLGCLEEEDG